MRSDTKIRLHKLSVQNRGADYVVGYEPTRAYITVDEKGLSVINDFENMTLGAIERKHKHADVKGILAQLIENGLVHKINHRVITAPKPAQDILNLAPSSLKWIHHPLTQGTLLGLATLTFIILLTQPQLLPNAEWFFATKWLSLLLPGVFLLAWFLHFLHELGHYAAIRAAGFPTGFHLAHRWHLLVAEADFAHLSHLTPKQQTRALLAGAAVDMLILLTAFIFIGLGIATGFWQLIALLVWISLLVQLLPLAYTDATKIAQKITSRQDILSVTWQSVRSLCLFCKKDVAQKDMQLRANTLPWAIAGIFLGITIVLVYILPILYEIIAYSAQTLLEAARLAQTALVVDSVIALMLCSVFVSMYSISLIREHHLGARSWFSWFSILLFITANFVVVFLLGLVLVLFASPLIATIAFLILGAVFGSLFLSIMDHVRIEQTGFAQDTVLPIYAASTGILLVLLLAAIPLTQGIETIYGVAYAVGMLGSLMS